MNSTLIGEAGFHFLKISTSLNDENNIGEEKILFTTSAMIKNIEFEGTQGKGKIPKKYTHRYSETKKIAEKI